MALSDDTLAFVGCGMMGEAMVKGLLRQGLVDPRQVIASHPRAERCLELENRYGIAVTDDNRDAVTDALRPNFASWAPTWCSTSTRF